MKNIAFITLLDTANTQAQLANSLKEIVNSWFITSSKKDIKTLEFYGVDRKSILDLSITRNEFRLKKYPRDTIEILGKFEDPRLPIGSIIEASRMLNSESSQMVQGYMAETLLKIEHFFLDNKIDWVFAEPSDLMQLLGQLVCWKNQIKFGQISLARHPSDRLILMSDCTETNFYNFGQQVNFSDRQEVEIWLSEFRKNWSRPSYFKRISNLRSIRSLVHSLISRIPIIVKELTGRDELHGLKTSLLIKMYVRNLLRKYSKKQVTITELKRKYVIYFLHVQPERSIDVMAPNFVNQIEVIKQIRRSLPWEISLLVKDHPASDGAQSSRFYSELKKISGVEFVNASVDSRELILKSISVITITGTVAYEAALLNKPAVMFGNLFFSHLPLIHVYSNPEELNKFFIGLMRLGAEDPQLNAEKKIVDYLMYLNANSVLTDWDGFYGHLSDQTLKSMVQLIKKSSEIQPQ